MEAASVWKFPCHSPTPLFQMSIFLGSFRISKVTPGDLCHQERGELPDSGHIEAKAQRSTSSLFFISCLFDHMQKGVARWTLTRGLSPCHFQKILCFGLESKNTHWRGTKTLSMNCPVDRHQLLLILKYFLLCSVLI